MTDNLNAQPAAPQEAAQVAEMLRKVLEFRNSEGTIEAYFLPPALAKAARAMIAAAPQVPDTEAGHT